MQIPSLDTVTKLYTHKTELFFVRLRNSRLAGLNKAIFDLFRSLGEQKKLSFWQNIIIKLKKSRFELLTLPVPARQVITPQLLTSLNADFQVCRDSFPDNFGQLSRTIQTLSEVQEQENVLMDWIDDQCIKNNTLKTCLCLLQSRYVRPVEQMIKEGNKPYRINMEVTSPQGLKNFKFFDRIFFCGSINLFSENQFRNVEFVWRAPRAPKLYFLSFDWIRDNFEPKPTLDVKPNRLLLKVSEVKVPGAKAEENDPQEKNNDEDVDAGDIDFSPVELILPKPSAATNVTYEAICESRLLVLEDGSFLYKEIESSSRIVQFGDQTEIKKIPNKKLATGMPLIVRTEGSGDSIAAVADMLFGEDAESIRSKQDEWKIAFRKKLFFYKTAHEVADALTVLGAPTSNEINVRNWQRNDTIKPKDKNDFKAIMSFSGLESLTEEYWDNARKIDLMHKQAGKKISRLLLDRINDSTRDDLEKYGRIDVEIKGLAGKVSVIRIESILPQIYQVPSSRLNKVLNIEGDH